MPMVIAPRLVLVLATAAGLAGCASSGGGETPDAAVAAAPVTVQEAPYCPTVTLRENTTILDKRVADKQAYVASITETTRDCRVENGQLRLAVAIRGRVVPGAGASNGPVTLPVRIAVLEGDKVVYSKLGRTGATLQKGAGAASFAYVDNGIAVPQPTQRNLTIFAGFDEGPAPAGAQLRSDAR